MSSLLQTFPYEVLSEIFAATETAQQAPHPGTVVLSHVCHQWREAAVGDSALWLEIGVCHRDAHHLDVVTQLLQRSRGRKISLGINLGDRERPEKFRQLLFLLRKHLPRTCHLFIYAQWQTWQMITVAFDKQTYPSLSLLDVELITTPARPLRARGRRAVGSRNPIPAIPHRPAPLPPVVFSIPQGHPLLDRVRLNGVSVANASLPKLMLLRVGGNANPGPSLVGPDSRMNRWLLDGPKSLYFEDVQIPPMPAYIPQAAAEREPSTITHLLLSGLRATPRTDPGEDGRFEHSCMPFFDSLHTPRVRCLEIDGWDLGGRSWADFLAWLPEDIRWPCVVDLRITGMHFKEMDYVDVAFFLGSFPRMRHLSLQDCFPGTWEVALEALQMDETLCLGLKSIRIGDGLAILRNDPLPFAREHLGEEIFITL